MAKKAVAKGPVMAGTQNSKSKDERVGAKAPILQVRNLSKAFGAMKAVNDLSFEVPSGEVFGIAGPNGAGKTTVFNLITGFLQGSGEVRFEDKNVENLKPYQICHRGIARTLQIPQIFSTLDVYNNIRFGAHFGNKHLKDGNEAEIIHRVLEFVGLQDDKTTIAENMDLFHKKLIMLAAALATQPRLLLLDEPIGGLSLAEIGPLMELIRKINQELNITVIIIEHLMKVLKELSHRLMILHYGEEIRTGPPAEVMEDEKVKEVYLG
ncbi:MAG: ABC transporter ATP-binding protein [Desulfobacterales bacterium]|jgi:branched-chain amino acid transport system ATP-binding protein